MMTLHKLTAGDGYTYLTRQVASADQRRAGQSLADYYAATGNAPGRWLGAGAHDLDLSGVVGEAQMRALFGRGEHPDSDRLVAAALDAGASLLEARRAGRLGVPFSPDESRQTVAGFDLVFTPVKSVSLLWALGDDTVRRAVEDAHHAAVADAIGWLERNAVFTRIGAGGALQVETRGLIAAAFDHRESRLGDPDLHTHVAVANKVRAVVDKADGSPRWLSIDARTLYAAAVSASERYNTRLEDNLRRALGVHFVERADTVRRDARPVREVAGVPVSLIKAFSRRRAEVERRYEERRRTYRVEHGHDAPRSVQQKLAQQATLDTREGKPAPRRLADQLAEWRARATELLGDADEVDSLLTYVVHQPIAAAGDVDIRAIARNAIAVLESERSTWSRWNLLAEIERRTRPIPTATPQAREALVGAVFAAATAPAESLRIVNPTVETPRRELTRSDGELASAQHGSERFTTRRILDAEQRLLDGSREHTGLHVHPAVVREAVAEVEQSAQLTLDAGQRALTEGFVSDDRRIVAAVGPAGSGKTTAMRAACQAWEAAGRRVVPLATSAKSAEVLGAELGRRAENVHKFLHELSRHSPEDVWFILRRGDVLLVDEVGMAGTLRLDQLLAHARRSGAQIRLLGDPWQLGAVEAGGALRLITHDVGAIELTHVHRFNNEDEARATLHLRDGDPKALAFYATNDRIRSGTHEEMLDIAYSNWWTDVRAGQQSLLIASNGEEASALSARARLQRVASGKVQHDGVALHDGNTAGVGDWIVTRANMRLMQLNGGRDFVKNGDTWTVTAVEADSVTVRHLRHGAEVRLPAPYVARDVELAYAVTAHRAQGMTVDTAHTLVTDETTRESLYVAATRGRHGNHLYEVTDAHPERRPRSANEGSASAVRGRPRRAGPQRSGAERDGDHPVGTRTRQSGARAETTYGGPPPRCNPPETGCLCRTQLLISTGTTGGRMFALMLDMRCDLLGHFAGELPGGPRGEEGTRDASARPVSDPSACPSWGAARRGWVCRCWTSI